MFQTETILAHGLLNHLAVRAQLALGNAQGQPVSLHGGQGKAAVPVQLLRQTHERARSSPNGLEEEVPVAEQVGRGEPQDARATLHGVQHKVPRLRELGGGVGESTASLLHCRENKHPVGLEHVCGVLQGFALKANRCEEHQQVALDGLGGMLERVNIAVNPPKPVHLVGIVEYHHQVQRVHAFLMLASAERLIVLEAGVVMLQLADRQEALLIRRHPDLVCNLSLHLRDGRCGIRLPGNDASGRGDLHQQGLHRRGRSQPATPGATLQWSATAPSQPLAPT
mmetsp:Transcript_96588/g.288345  ORF Transcript_96588/g.288345 Transcript_96588/m.288345 type:complete len:282 (+) Transcript_96588:622-1467(+)